MSTMSTASSVCFRGEERDLCEVLDECFKEIQVFVSDSRNETRGFASMLERGEEFNTIVDLMILLHEKAYDIQFVYEELVSTISDIVIPETKEEQEYLFAKNMALITAKDTKQNVMIESKIQKAHLKNEASKTKLEIKITKLEAKILKLNETIEKLKGKKCKPAKLADNNMDLSATMEELTVMDETP